MNKSLELNISILCFIVDFYTITAAYCFVYVRLQAKTYHFVVDAIRDRLLVRGVIFGIELCDEM